MKHSKRLEKKKINKSYITSPNKVHTKYIDGKYFTKEELLNRLKKMNVCLSHNILCSKLDYIDTYNKYIYDKNYNYKIHNLLENDQANKESIMYKNDKRNINKDSNKTNYINLTGNKRKLNSKNNKNNITQETLIDSNNKINNNINKITIYKLNKNYQDRSLINNSYNINNRDNLQNLNRKNFYNILKKELANTKIEVAEDTIKENYSKYMNSSNILKNNKEDNIFNKSEDIVFSKNKSGRDFTLGKMNLKNNKDSVLLSNKSRNIFRKLEYANNEIQKNENINTEYSNNDLNYICKNEEPEINSNNKCKNNHIYKSNPSSALKHLRNNNFDNMTNYKKELHQIDVNADIDNSDNLFSNTINLICKNNKNYKHSNENFSNDKVYPNFSNLSSRNINNSNENIIHNLDIKNASSLFSDPTFCYVFNYSIKFICLGVLCYSFFKLIYTQNYRLDLKSFINNKYNIKLIAIFFVVLYFLFILNRKNYKKIAKNNYNELISNVNNESILHSEENIINYFSKIENLNYNYYFKYVYPHLKQLLKNSNVFYFD